MKRAQDERERKRLFLPARLVQLVQLCVLAKRALTGERLLPVDVTEKGALDPPVNTFARPPELDGQSIEGNSLNITHICSCCII